MDKKCQYINGEDNTYCNENCDSYYCIIHQAMINHVPKTIFQLGNILENQEKRMKKLINENKSYATRIYFLSMMVNNQAKEIALLKRELGIISESNIKIPIPLIGMPLNIKIDENNNGTGLCNID